MPASQRLPRPGDPGVSCSTASLDRQERDTMSYEAGIKTTLLDRKLRWI